MVPSTDDALSLSLSLSLSVSLSLPFKKVSDIFVLQCIANHGYYSMIKLLLEKDIRGSEVSDQVGHNDIKINIDSWLLSLISTFYHRHIDLPRLTKMTEICHLLCKEYSEF